MNEVMNEWWVFKVRNGWMNDCGGMNDWRNQGNHEGIKEKQQEEEDKEHEEERKEKIQEKELA